MRNLLAFDLGASNGRAILGQFDGETITMRELHRFENNYIEMNGVFYWDLPYLYNQLKQGLLAFKNANVGELDCIGIDTWGVDYGLLDKNGQLLSNPRSYRYAVDAGYGGGLEDGRFPDALCPHGHCDHEFQHRLPALPPQAAARPRIGRSARRLLMLPDLLGFFLTGEAKTEYTNATTSMLYNPTTKDWDWQTIDALGLPQKNLHEARPRGHAAWKTPPGTGRRARHQSGKFCRCRHARHGLCRGRHPRHGQLCVLLQRYMVAVRRGDGRADFVRCSSRRELLQRGHDPGRLPASEEHHGPVAHSGVPPRLAEGRSKPQLERHCGRGKKG